MKKHPAVYTNKFIPIFAELLQDKNNVLDPFAGTGKIGLIKEHGYNGIIYANEIEPEWLIDNLFNCDILTYEDAEVLNYPNNFFEAICTSPTYGNRMADHHNARDGSKRISYTHCLGRKLNPENTGYMQWGNEYREKHIKIYKHIAKLLKEDGIFILNISDHIRKGEIMHVSEWHKDILMALDLGLVKEIEVEVPRMRFGKNSEKRINCEKVYVFQKK